MKEKVTESFGQSSSIQYEVIDIFTWKKLVEEANIGMVYEVYTEEMGGRQVKKARVASFRDTLHYEILVMELKLVSKAK